MSQRYWSDFVGELSPYVPGEQPNNDQLLKLNTNENPYGPSPRVMEAISAQVNDGLRLYPPPAADELTAAIAKYYGIDASQIFVGNGSDEVLAHIFYGLLKHDKPILFPDITYSFYPVYCGLYGIDYQTIALRDDFTIAVDDYVQPNNGIIIANPNAPTGVPLALGEIEKLLQLNPDSVVVIDEAYVDFGGESAIALVKRFPNLVVVQTLSKSRSLAGLRVGFAVADADLIEALERVKNSFNSYPLDRLAIAGGIAAFEDEEYFQSRRRQVIESREALVAELVQLDFEVLPSAANFLFARHKKYAGATLAQALREAGVLVRHFDKPRISDFLRITVGDEQQNKLFVVAMSAAFKSIL
ncbi:MAG: histidinol-phosphate transaminase [Porticoccaceae bacterium]